MFSIDIVPSCVEYAIGEHRAIKDLTFFERFEVFVAIVLKARLAHRWNKGFDVYDSAIYPKLTFQVKAANHKIFESRGIATWTWNGDSRYGADWYILFGVIENSVYSFCLSHQAWLKRSSLTSKTNKRVLISSTEKYWANRNRYSLSSKKRVAKLWRYEVKNWPADLFNTIEGNRIKDLPLFSLLE